MPQSGEVNAPLFSSTPEYNKAKSTAWKVMVVDDDESVHATSNMVFRHFTFIGKGLKMIRGYSAKEACQLLEQNPDTATLLLDIVLESDDAGLKVIKYVREHMNNHCTQIILRTGQAGQFSEEEVRNHEVNAYSTKSELTADRLNALLITSLRAFRDIRTYHS